MEIIIHQAILHVLDTTMDAPVPVSYTHLTLPTIA